MTPDTSGQPVASAAPAAAGREPAAVLIVADEAAERQMLAHWLRGAGCACGTVSGEASALEWLEHDGRVLAVVDLTEPGGNVLGFLGTIARWFPDVAVVLVTDEEGRRAAVRAVAMGAYGYFIRPLRREETIVGVLNAFEHHRLALQVRVQERLLAEALHEHARETRFLHEQIALRLLAVQRHHHDETAGHTRRIGLYAEAVARHLGKTGEAAESLRLAASVHDVGKIGIPDSILLKPGKLTEDEREIVRQHTTIGGRVLAGTSIPILNLSRDIALYHHECWDGSGYPQGIGGEHIPEPARVVAVLDSFDALVHPRVYRPALPEAEAVGIVVAGDRRQFDPAIVRLFLDVLPELDEIRREVQDLPADEPVVAA